MFCIDPFPVVRSFNHYLLQKWSEKSRRDTDSDDP